MQRLILALVLGVFSLAAQAATVTIDPSGFEEGTDISNSFAGVTLFNAQGSFATEDVGGIEVSVLPLTLTGTQTSVYSVGGLFGSNAGSDIWSAGSLGRDEVLRVDFSSLVSFVSVDFLPDDLDSGWLFAYDDQDILLSVQDQRDADPFMLSFTASGADISYILATYSDKAMISKVSYALVPIPAAAWLFGSALGLLGWIRRKTA